MLADLLGVTDNSGRARSLHPGDSLNNHNWLDQNGGKEGLRKDAKFLDLPT